MLRSLILAVALLTSVQAAMARAPKTWTQVGMLACKLNPSIGFVIFGHQSMECRFVQNPPSPVQFYEGALNTVGVDIGISAGGVLGWAVLAPTAGPPPGALHAPASVKLEFLAKSLFIPIFFVVTGFLIDPITFVYGIFDNFLLVASIIGALLVGKWIAAWGAGRAFGYSRNEQLTIWSLTLPQVAATLAATLVAHETLGVAGQRLLDDRMLNVVLVLVFATSVLGPVLPERSASRLTTGTPRAEPDRRSDPHQM